MKPELLTMAGFAPFRAATTVRFSDLELFALTGPTGAGKSSVIDAITFALYGTVARHGKGAVEPVISLGSAEAKIQFDFSVEERPYTAVRVVRRTARGGATTAEARLESQGEVLASGAAEVTSAVEALLGLNIGHFTRSVVLPQGEFAAFLHDTPAGQQDLVKALLDLGILDTVRSLAGERGRTASALAGGARARIEGLADATEEAEKAAASRLDMLEGLVGDVTAAETALASALEEARLKREETEKRRMDLDLVTRIRVPAGVGALAESLVATRKAVNETRVASEEAAASLELLRLRSAQLPSRDRLQTATDVATQLEATRARLVAIDLEGLSSAADELAAEVDSLAAAREAAVAAREAGRSRHAAHALAAGLGVGDPCPVCHRPLEAEPEEPPADLARAESEVRAAEKALSQASARFDAARHVLTGAQATMEAEQRALEALETQGRELPTGDELAEQWDARHRLESDIAAAQEALGAAQEACRLAAAELAGHETDETAAREAFSAARDRVARLEPPVATVTDDLSRVWGELAEWAETEAEGQRQRLEAAATAAAQAEIAHAEANAQVENLLAGAGVGGEGSPSARLAGAVATARADHTRVQERRAEREAVEADLATFEDRALLAGELARHLRANNFEGWLLAEGLHTLVDGANGLLTDLSRHAYSLELVNGKIEVVDHRNADEHRSVRSLSGGETFLVSLALALSLGEQLVNLSERGGARLDAIFLDEGFGSLDDETLDTVTAVVSELAAQGRVVGIVTHVKELADQLPVRFVVRPGPGGSTIERVG
ncbi:MAG TPA: SMC family ATPase [Acidimicrobiia bacterium]|nr:SMC family ATPase [Acidimicrobiia bacterium]